MALNPFEYTAPVGAEHLVDREEEAALLLSLAEGGHFTRLSAPRRFGKTSLLERVRTDAEAQAGMSTALVDLFGVVDRIGFAVRLQQAYRSFRGPVGRVVDGLLVTARLKAGAGPIGAEVEARLDPVVVERLIGELLELPVRAHARTGRRCLVVLDEFQDLLRAGDGLDALLRSHIQHHAPAASYAFAGSHPGLMAELFSDRERPLYGQARPIELGPLHDADLAEHVTERFARAGREAGGALGYLLAEAEGHPQRAMLLAHHLFEATPPRGAAAEEQWQAARANAYAELGEAFARSWASLGSAEQKVLAALARPDGAALFSTATLARLELASGSASRARDRLVARGDLVAPAGSRPRLVDPLWRRWIAAGRRAPAA